MRDLLCGKGKGANLKIRQSGKLGTVVEGLSGHCVNDMEGVVRLINRCEPRASSWRCGRARVGGAGAQWQIVMRRMQRLGLRVCAIATDDVRMVGPITYVTEVRMAWVAGYLALWSSGTLTSHPSSSYSRYTPI